MNTISESLPRLLNAQFEKQGIRANRLSALSGVNEASISNLLHGKRGVTDETLLAISKALNLSHREMLEMLLMSAVERNRGDVRKLWLEIVQMAMSKGKTRSGAHNGVLAVSDQESTIPLFECILPGFSRDFDGRQIGELPAMKADAERGCFGLLVDGDAMRGPDSWLANCDYALFEPYPGKGFPIGEVVCIFVKGWKECGIKRLQRDPRGLILLCSDNPAFPPIEFDPRETRLIIRGIIIEKHCRFRRALPKTTT